MYKVLLVDDELFVLNGLKKLILSFSSEIGEICTAQNGVEALAAMQQSPADIVFTDIKMPGMDGMELIERLVQRNATCKIIILSGYDNFVYAQQAIANNIKAYLLKPIIKADLQTALLKVISEIAQETSHDDYLHRLQQQLESSLPLLKEKFFYDLANGRYQKETADFLGLHYDNGSYKIALISLDAFTPNAFPPSLLEKEKQLALLAVANDLKDGLPPTLNYTCFRLQHRICILLSMCPQQNNNFLEVHLKEFQKKMQSQNNLSLSIGVSSLFECVEDFSIYLEQAYSALKHKLYVGDSSLVFYDNIASAVKKPLFVNNAQLKNQIYQALMGEQHDRVKTLLQEMQNDLSTHQFYPSEMIKTIGIDILSIFSIFAFEQNIDPKELMYHNQMPSESVFVATTIDGIFSILFETHHKICQCMQLKNEHQASSTVCIIKKYVWDHIEEDVSLDALSNVVYLTPNYISALFRRETDISFKEYVLNAKMRRAKELLAENKFKIYEVAEAVGYKSVPYFSKLFKKATGVYPSDYHPE